MTPEDVEIARHVAAMRRHVTAIDVLKEQAKGACCPTCYHGATYVDAVEHAKRCADNLGRLASKRGAAEDRRIVDCVRHEDWDLI